MFDLLTEMQDSSDSESSDDNTGPNVSHDASPYFTHEPTPAGAKNKQRVTSSLESRSANCFKQIKGFFWAFAWLNVQLREES